MKKFLNSIYFYPFIAIAAIFLGLIGFYFYAIDEAQESVIRQQLQDKREAAFIFKSIAEELSMNKKKSSLQREATRFASNMYTSYVLLIRGDGTVLYASRYRYMGKNLKDILGEKLAKHYMQEIREKREEHIHPFNKTKIDITFRLNYLYDYMSDTIEPGYMIAQYDISGLIAKQTKNMQKELLFIFIVTASIVLLFFYFFYRYFIAKLYKIEKLTTLLAGKKEKREKLISIDSAIERLLQTITKFAVMSKVMEYSNDAIVVTDSDRKIIAVNPAFEELTGYKADEVIGKRPEDLLKSGLMDEKFYEKMWDEIEKKGVFQGEITDRRKDGTNYTVWQKISSVKDPNTGEVTNYIAISQDISELLEKQKEVEHLVYYDTLTNLINRSYFLHLTKKMIKTHPSEHFAMFYIDLDNFKDVNVAFGRPAGDILLKKFAAYLKENLSKKDIIARITADEFAVFSPDVKGPEEALDLGCKIQEFGKKAYKIDDKKIEIGVSVGIAFFPDDGGDAEALLRAADVALNRSKQDGKNRCTLFKQEMQEEATKKIQLRQELKDAIAHNELILYYQPKFSIKEKRVVGFEALIRWIHPEKGFIGPDMFIPIAEESGLIVDMTNWIFKEFNKTCSLFKDAHKEKFSIAVNISSNHFKERSLIKEIESSIDKRLINEGYLELEVTESAIMSDVELAKRQLHVLNGMGVTIALDDFGTGYSSLAYLKSLPISTLKIDKSFIDGLCIDKKDYAIVKSAIELARSLGMKTVAEGVEDLSQVEKLRSLHADYIQGYVYSRPLKKEDAIKLLKDGGFIQ